MTTSKADPSTHRYRLSLRARLALIYGTVFAIAAVAILATVYLIVQHSLAEPPRGEFAVMSDGASGSTIAIGNIPAQSLDAQQVIWSVTRAVDETRATTLRNLVLAIAAILGVSLAGAVLGGRWLARYALSPLRHVTATAATIAGSGDLDKRIAMTGPRDEITDLSRTVDLMLDRLRDSFDSHRRFISHVSHELRTPLAIERTLLQITTRDEVTRDWDAVKERLLDLNRRNTATIEDLLALAIGEQPVVEQKPVDLVATVRAVLDTCRAEAERHDSSMTADLRPATSTGNAVLIERALTNLVRNAIVHSPHGSTIDIRTSATADYARFEVRNPGHHLDAATIARIQQPFERGTTKANGSGLGLPIVHAIVSRHHGSVRLTAQPTGGLTAAVTLPAGREVWRESPKNFLEAEFSPPNWC